MTFINAVMGVTFINADGNGRRGIFVTKADFHQALVRWVGGGGGDHGRGEVTARLRPSRWKEARRRKAQTGTFIHGHTNSFLRVMMRRERCGGDFHQPAIILP